MKTLKAKLLTPSIIVAGLLASSPAIADYISYKHPDYHTRISFPEEMFEWREKLSTDQSGMKFTSEDGGSLVIFAYEANADITLKDIANSLRENTDENFNITYERITKNWVVQSGYQNGQIYYQRMELSPSGNMHGMLLKYPQTLRGKYDKHIGKIARSLRGN